MNRKIKSCRKSYRAWLQAGFALTLLFGLWVASLPTGIDVGIQSGDKILHSASFFLFAAWLDLCSQRSFWRFQMPILLAYGALVEIMQAFLPWRSFSMLDLAADLAGVVLYWLLSRLLLRQWRLA